ncbi:MAG: amino acid permease [Thermodesulfobacteriota bacterium]
MSNPEETEKTAHPRKFGTFKGVFTPSLLTILGVIMYLRFGWVVGNAGIAGAVVIVLLAHVISVTTGMSISSIATNRQVRTGGDYYMISRSLGLPMGGAIGLSLFFALTFSTSLYVIGFTESLHTVLTKTGFTKSVLDYCGMPDSLLDNRVTGSAACFILTGISFLSTSLALRIQYLVLMTIGLSLVSLFAGSPLHPTLAQPALWFPEGSETFEVVFAVFFPAVTGFTAGVAMSGDLKNPARAIPLGTMSAIMVGFIIYLAIPLFLGFKVGTDTLRNDPMIWLTVARVPWLIIAGVFAATLSSALGSVLGAPRYLQALARDGVVPRFLGRGSGPLNEPRLGTVITFLIAEAGILLGELNLIARIITMFFLTSYGFACLACGIQSWSGITSFRPTFRTPAWVSFFGAAICFGIMFKLDAPAMAGATAAMIAIFLFLQKRASRTKSIDNWRGFWTAVVHRGLLYLNRKVSDGQNWRPNVIVFGGDPIERRHLLDMAGWMFHNRGLITYFSLLPGDIVNESIRARLLESNVKDTVRRLSPDVMARVLVTPDIYDGILGAAQTYGFSGLIPNTILMGWGEETAQPDRFTAMIRGLLALDRNLMLLRHDDDRSFGPRRTIDIWWRGRDRNAELMLLMAHLLQASEAWKGARVRVNVVVDHHITAEKVAARLKEVIAAARLNAAPNIILRGGKSTAEVIRENSGQTDIVFLGLQQPPPDGSADYITRVGSFMTGLGSVLLVRASSRFDSSTLFPDET